MTTLSESLRDYARNGFRGQATASDCREAADELDHLTAENARMREALESALTILTGRNGGDTPHARNVMLKALGRPTDQAADRAARAILSLFTEKGDG